MSRRRNYDKDESRDEKKTRDTDKRSRKPRNRTSNSRDSKQEEAKPKTLDYTSKYNLPSYYFKDPVLLQQATQLSFQSFLGYDALGAYQVPTIMALYLNPSPGLTFQGASASVLHPARAGVNMAALKLYNLLSMKSGRNMAYAPQDVTTLILALGELYSTLSFIKRAMGIVKMSNVRNRMYPKAIVEAMGIDYDDLIANWSDYRTHINAEIASVNQIPLLRNCGYLNKCFSQYDWVFTDDDSPMAQSYLFLPYSTWIIDETSYSGGTILKTVPFCGNGTNFNKVTQTMGSIITNILRPMIDALVMSSTLNLIYADILHLSDDSAFKTESLQIIPDDYVVYPVHNYEALLHIHNATAVGIPNSPGDIAHFTTPQNDVYPDPANNALMYNPGFEASFIGTSPWPLEHIICDSPNPNPGLDERLEMTRYKSVVTGNSITINGTKYWNYVLNPDHYVVFMRIWDNDTTDNGDYFINVRTSAPASATYHRLSQFDWAPMFITFNNANPNQDNITGIHGDLNFYTITTGRYLGRLNQACYLGLFDI